MATLTKSTGTVTLSGAVEKVTLPAAYGWVWLKNMSDADMFAGLSADISEGADGVMVIPSGECGRIQTDGFNSIYLVGTGNALVVAQNYADCPFKLGGKGGEAPDLSAYAKKTEIPTVLPADGGNADYATNAGNADTVDGYHAAAFLQNTVPFNLSTSINDMTTAGTYGVYSVTPDFPTGYGSWGFLEVRRFGNLCYQSIIFETGIVITRGKDVTFDIWNNWSQAYTNLNKPYVTGTLSEQANDSPVTLSFTIFDFTPSKVICQFGSGNAFFANVVTNGFSLTIPAGTTTIHYIAFK